MLIDWVASINPNDLHALALTNSLLFREAEKYRWNTIKIEINPSVGKGFEAASEVLYRVEGRPARATHLRLDTTKRTTLEQTSSFRAFVRRFLKDARGLRTLHFRGIDGVDTLATLLNGFANLPFKLTEFAILSRCWESSVLVGFMVGFIVSQPTIECLSIASRELAYALPRDALPNLAAVAVSSNSTHAVQLAEGRPVKYLFLAARGAPSSLSNTLQALETMIHKSTQPITAISLVGSSMEDIILFLPHLLRLVPGLRFLGCEWPAEHPDHRARGDLELLRSFTRLECIRWRSGKFIPRHMQRLKWRRLNPRNYAGPSLRVVQQESTCGRPPSEDLAKVEGIWRPSEEQSDCWHFHAGEFLAPPLLPELRLVRTTPAGDLFVKSLMSIWV